MIGIRTPFRMSFVGGGTDLKEFYSRHPGCVLSTTINKYMYIFIHPFFDNRIQIKYSRTELVERIEEIEHPIVREALKKFKLSGLDINSIADIPAGTGLGSSSSYTVSLYHALYNYTGQQVSPDQLARDACELEIDILNEPIGKQDQYAAAYGGLNLIRFLPSGVVKVEPVKIKPKIYNKLQNNLLMFYTGTTRRASDILNDQKKNLINENAKFDTLLQMTKLAEQAKDNLCESDLEGFGKTLDENWQLKKSLSNKISNMDMDDLYAVAMKNGALGGKLLGAGGGGFFLFYCKKKQQNKLRIALNKFKEITFNFEKNGSMSINFNHLNKL
jgi:D-glycero-alpha-D-manno-heptose-7-phosphate kinase